MDGRLFIVFLYVVPGARRKGAGAALVRHVVAETRGAPSCRSVNVALSRESRDLHRFYQALGFRGGDGQGFSDGAPMAVWALQ